MQPDQLQNYWIDLALSGDRAAQHALYNMYSKAMYNISLRLTGNRHDAEDIVQDAFVIAFQKLDQLQSKSHFGGWLKRIVINASLKEIQHRHTWKQLDDDWDAVDEDGANSFTEIPMEQINSAIQDLPAGGRQVFVLYLMEGLKHKEIAELLQISESTSKSQYIRAKSLLRTQLLNIKNKQLS